MWFYYFLFVSISFNNKLPHLILPPSHYWCNQTSCTSSTAIWARLTTLQGTVRVVTSESSEVLTLEMYSWYMLVLTCAENETNCSNSILLKIIGLYVTILLKIIGIIGQKLRFHGQASLWASRSARCIWSQEIAILEGAAARQNHTSQQSAAVKRPCNGNLTPSAV